MATPNQEVCASSEIETDICKPSENLTVDSKKIEGEAREKDVIPTTEHEKVTLSHTDSEHDNTRQPNINTVSSGNLLQAEMSNDDQQQSDRIEPVQSDNQLDSIVLDKCDCMMKRTKISHKWENTYFQLKDTSLYYGTPPKEKNVAKGKYLCIYVTLIKQGVT